MRLTVDGSLVRPSPRGARALLGAVCAVVGAVLVTRPFASLSVLVFLVAVAGIATGVTQWATARSTPERADDVVAAGWVAVGVAVAVWPDLSVRGVALIVGVGMVVGGVGDVVGGLRGTHDERLASLLKGLASVVFGVLALAWPDVTLLVVAVVFGARTVLFGLSELVGAVRDPDRETASGEKPPGLFRRGVHVVGATAALVVALVLGSVSVALHAAEGDVDAFYAAPDEVPAEPGRLIRSERAEADVPEGARGWRILYTTTRADGVPAVASGLVVVPDDVDGPVPIVSWAHGTTGVDETCAPTVMDAGLGAGAFFLTGDVIDEGWALVATDYVGLGTDGPHPYLVGNPTARSVLDATRAARQLDDVDLADETVVWGHSQGGGAALWTGQLAADYAPDAGVIGVAALAPASDVASLMSNLYEIPGGSLFASYALVGYASVYDDVSIDDYVAPAARTSVLETADRCLSAEILPSILGSLATDMSAFSNDLTAGPLAARLAENVPTGPYPMPLLIGQGADDVLVLPQVQAAFVESLCSGGVDVDYRTYEGRNHVPLVEPDSPVVPELLDWTRDRFAGEPFVGNCDG